MKFGLNLGGRVGTYSVYDEDPPEEEDGDKGWFNFFGRGGPGSFSQHKPQAALLEDTVDPTTGIEVDEDEQE